MSKLTYKRRSVNSDEKLVDELHLSTQIILDAAEELGLEWRQIPYTDLFELKYQGKTRFFYGRIPNATSSLATHCCVNKNIAKNLLAKNKLSVSRGFLLTDEDKKDYSLEVFKTLNKPLVVKPNTSSLGRNVFLKIDNEADFLSAIEKIKTYYGEQSVEILVEEMFVGDEYRILASREKVLSVIKRIPANIVGDGQSTIEALIKAKNSDETRKIVDTYHQIEINDKLKNFLQEQDLNLSSVLEKGRQVFLLPHTPFDMGLGGDTVDVTEQIHPSVKQIILQAMKSIPGLVLAGFDFMTQDIEAEQTADSYRIIELNSSPFIDWNQFPLKGDERAVALEFIKLMFPDLST